MKIGSAESGVCSSCNCEHYYEIDNCYVAVERKLNQTEARLEATQHALKLALTHLEKTSAGWVKEIEAHRQTTLKLVKLQDKQR